MITIVWACIVFICSCLRLLKVWVADVEVMVEVWGRVETTLTLVVVVVVVVVVDGRGSSIVDVDVDVDDVSHGNG